MSSHVQKIRIQCPACGKVYGVSVPDPSRARAYSFSCKSCGETIKGKWSGETVESRPLLGQQSATAEKSHSHASASATPVAPGGHQQPTASVVSKGTSGVTHKRRFRCKNCRSEFVLEVPDEGGLIKANCPKCLGSCAFRLPAQSGQAAVGGSKSTQEPVEWYLSVSPPGQSGKVFGPLSVEGLHRMILAGKIRRNHRLRRGQGPWREAYSYEELRPLFDRQPAESGARTGGSLGKSSGSGPGAKPSTAEDRADKPVPDKTEVAGPASTGSAAVWFVSRAASGDRSISAEGPFSVDQVRDMIRGGKLKSYHHVRSHHGDWVSANEQPSFKKCFDEVRQARNPQNQPPVIQWYVSYEIHPGPSTHADGPFGVNDLEDLILQGKLKSYHWVRNHDGDWVGANDVPALEPFFEAQRRQRFQAHEGSEGASDPPPPPEKEKKWYFLADGLTAGPFTFEEIRQQVASGALEGDDSIRSNGNNWRKIRDFEELRAHLVPDAPHIPEQSQAASVHSTGFYRVLDIPANASQDEIKKAYFGLVRKHPPEKDPEGFMAIRAAYETLSDPKSRTKYDARKKYGAEVSDLFAKAELHMADEQWEEAEKALKRLLVLAPSEDMARNTLGLCLMHQKKFDEAIDLYSKLTESEGEIAVYWMHFGYSYMEKVDQVDEDYRKSFLYQSARKCFERVIELEAHNASPYLQLARICSGEKRYSEALAWAEKSANADGKIDFTDFEALFYKCTIYIFSRQFENVEQGGRRILSLAPDDDAKKYGSARFVESAGQFLNFNAFEPAAVLLKVAILFDPGDAQLRGYYELVDRVHKASEEWDQMQNDSLVIEPICKIAGIFLFDCTKNPIENRDALLDGWWGALQHFQVDHVLKVVIRVRDRYPNLYKLRQEFYDGVIKDLQKSTAPSATETQSGSQGGCFIATAAFGTPDEPLIQIYRDFRDRILRPYFLGRCVIACYEVLGPWAARVIARSSVLRKAVRMGLAKLVGLIKHISGHL